MKQPEKNICKLSNASINLNQKFSHMYLNKFSNQKTKIPSYDKSISVVSKSTNHLDNNNFNSGVNNKNKMFNSYIHHKLNHPKHDIKRLLIRSSDNTYDENNKIKNLHNVFNRPIFKQQFKINAEPKQFTLIEDENDLFAPHSFLKWFD